MAQLLDIPIRFQFVKIPVVWAHSGAFMRGKPVTVKPDARAFHEMDGCQCLSDFLALRDGDTEALQKFLTKVGAYDISAEADFSPWSQREMRVNLKHIWSFRDVLEHVMIQGDIQDNFLSQIAPAIEAPKSYLDLWKPHPGNKFVLRFELSKTKSFSVTVTNAFHMLLAQALTDIASHVRYKRCKRRDCNRLKIFRVESAHDRDYCGQYCGHIESVRRNRRKAAIKSDRRK